MRKNRVLCYCCPLLQSLTCTSTVDEYIVPRHVAAHPAHPMCLGRTIPKHIF